MSWRPLGGALVLVAVVTGIQSGPTRAQSYPSKPIRIIVPFAPGGPNDILARLIGQKLTEAWGQQVIVENRKGAGPAMIDLLSGQITWMFGTILSSVPHIKTARLHVLAVSTSRRAPLLPDVPTVAETLPGFEAPTWYGVSVSAGMPREVIVKLNREIAKALGTSEIRERLAKEGAEVTGSSPEEFDVFFKNEIEKWAKVIRNAGIKLE